MKRPFAIPVIAACALAGTVTLGCAATPEEEAPASSTNIEQTSDVKLSNESLDAAASFSLNLLRTSMDVGAPDATVTENAAKNDEAARSQSEGKAESASEPARASTDAATHNRLISPYSVASALGMTANGAQGQTRAQMESTLGMSISDMNAFMAAYASTLPSDDEARINIANSLWVNEKVPVENTFLETNAAYYGAGVFTAPFDKTTKDRINGWVADNTDDMIDSIIDNVTPDMAMCLANAIAFDAKWMSPYEETQVAPGTFTTENGEKQDASMMGSTEHAYLENDLSVGFAKPYAGGAYAFVALLPNEGISLSEYIGNLDGTMFRSTIANARSAEVEAYLPKFEAEQSLELAQTLGAMGMTDAFDAGVADFSGISAEARERSLHVDRIMHKTFISVAEQGTRAGAATSVSIRTTAAMPDEEPKIVRLDRPFVYAIVDTQTNLPLFIGAVGSLK